MLQTVTYDGHVWTYSYTTSGLLQTVTPPLGPSWQYAYDSDGNLSTVTTPDGGQITYSYESHEFPVLQVWPPNNEFLGTTVFSLAVTHKHVEGRSLQVGDWSYAYATTPDGQNTIVTSPSATTTYAFTYGPASLGLPEQITVADLSNPPQTLSMEQSDWQFGPEFGLSPDGLTASNLIQLGSQAITRDGATYTSTYSYNTTMLGDYNRPYQVVETAADGSARTTTRSFDYTAAFYCIGSLGSETTSINGENFTRQWSHDAQTGFLTSQSDYGVQTTFTSDGLGNNGAITNANGQQTTYHYSWGTVDQIVTPEYAIARSVNSDGTVASETRGGRTTQFTYDALFRLTTTWPAGGTSTFQTSYDNVSDATVYPHRGAWGVTKTLDGFGRTIATVDNAGIHSSTTFDAEGRITYDGLPYGGSQPVDRGVQVAYDALGRVTQRTNADGSSSNYSYGPSQVTITDEKAHATTYVYQAFGHPDDGRLVELIDPNMEYWFYTYNAIGALTAVTAPDGSTHSWTRDSKNFLLQETHPDSGTVQYTAYDAVGNLLQKTDANGAQFLYARDGNNRLKTLTAGSHTIAIQYETGLDVQNKTTVDGVVTLFHIDGSGRTDRIDETIDGETFTTSIAYTLEDNIAGVVYPSGRNVTYQYDADWHITKVTDATFNTVYANNFTYHPSAAVQSVTTGDGTAHVTTYDSYRYWVTRASATNATSGVVFDAIYSGYDLVGNVGTITDARMGVQNYTYDPLDRLTGASGPWGSAQYPYDVLGNRQTYGSVSYTYTGSHLTGVGMASLTYDSNGNLSSGPNVTYSYTPTNQVAVLQVGPATTTYQYDANNWRIKKTNNAATTYQLRDLNGRLLTEWTNPGGASESIRDFIYAGDRVIAVVGW